MSQSRFNREMGEVADSDSRTPVKTAAATLAIYEQNVIADTTSGAMAITLPPVGEAKGLIFTIELETDGGNLTVQDQDDSIGWSDMTLTAVDDHVCLFSDGRIWHVLHDTTT